MGVTSVEMGPVTLMVLCTVRVVRAVSTTHFMDIAWTVYRVISVRQMTHIARVAATNVPRGRVLMHLLIIMEAPSLALAQMLQHQFVPSV